MDLVQTESTTYVPEWTFAGYRDACPIQKGHRVATPYICNCRHKADTFTTNSEFTAHIKNKYHQTWVSKYHDTVSKDMELLNRENGVLKRDKSILQGQVSKWEARVHRLESEASKFDEKYQELKRQMESQHNLELNELAQSTFLLERANTELEGRLLAEMEVQKGLQAKLEKIKSVLA